MNVKFARLAESLEPAFQRLIQMTPVWLRRDRSQTLEKGNWVSTPTRWPRRRSANPGRQTLPRIAAKHLQSNTETLARVPMRRSNVSLWPHVRAPGRFAPWLWPTRAGGYERFQRFCGVSFINASNCRRSAAVIVSMRRSTASAKS